MSSRRGAIKLDIRVLRYFLAICEEGNMSRAARALHVTQPTLSRQIAELERELGCELLERGARTAVPTEKGRYLRRRAEDIVSLADQTAQNLRRDDALVEGDVTIGAGESEGMHALAQQIQGFRQKHPHVRFHLRSGNSTDVIDWLERGLVDFAVLMSYHGIDRYPHLRLAPIDTWGVLIPEGDELCRHDAIAPKDLAELPLIVSEQALDSGEMQGWLGSTKDSLNIAATYNLAFNAGQLVRQHVGYALALDKLVATGESTGLAFRPLNPPLTSVIDFAWKQGQAFTSASKRFLDQMKKAARA